MRNDIKSNYALLATIAAASIAPGVANGISVDHADGSSVSFNINVGTVGASGTIDAKTQYSDNNSDWADYPAVDEANNDDAIVQIVAAGEANLHIPNPRGRYSRVVVTTAVAASVVSVVSVLGPLRHVAA